MEEFREDFFHFISLVVDEGIEEAGGAVHGQDIVVGDGCGDEGAVAFL